MKTIFLNYKVIMFRKYYSLRLATYNSVFHNWYKCFIVSVTYKYFQILNDRHFYFTVIHVHLHHTCKRNKEQQYSRKGPLKSKNDGPIWVVTHDNYSWTSTREYHFLPYVCKLNYFSAKSILNLLLS